MWISVKDRLPDGNEESDDMLCYASKWGEGEIGHKYIGYYDQSKKAWMYEHFGDFVEYDNNADYWSTTHWQPLPEDPIFPIGRYAKRELKTKI